MRKDNVVTILENIWGIMRFFVLIPNSIKRIKRYVAADSYYPECQRKSGRKIWSENLKYLFKNREVNPYYLSYGFDVENLRNQEEYLTHREFIRLRARGNQYCKKTETGYYNSIVLLRDKYLFANYLGSVLGEKCVVPTIALKSEKMAYFMCDKKWHDLRELLEDGTTRVYKIIDGECADGVMLVSIHENQIRVDGKQYSTEEFISLIENQRLIVQEVVEQHDALKAFRTKSVNTIRIVTIRDKTGKVGVFAAFLRLSQDSESFVDNRAKGGLGVGIELDTGKLMKYGLPHDAYGIKTEIHELSSIRFMDYQIPFWSETMDLVCSAHKQFYDIQSIGWDVVITQKGPILLEGNDDWEIGGPQDTSGGLKKRWDELVNAK